MRTSTILQKIAFFIIAVNIFLIPILFVPITSDFYEFNKSAFLTISTLVLLFLWVFTFITDRQVKLTRSPLGLPMLGLAAAWLLSTFLKSPNLNDAFFEPTQTGSILTLIVFFFVSINLIKHKHELDTLSNALITSLAVIASLSILWGSGLASKVAPATFLQTPAWSPVGNAFSALTLMICFLPFLAILAFKEKKNSTRSLLVSLTLLLSVIGSGVLAYRLFKPGSEFRPLFMPQSTAWAISLEALKISPLFGTGPSTYSQVFTQFRPISYNLSPLWATRFTSASNYYLHLLTTVGLLGLVTYIFLVARQLGITTKLLKFASDSSQHTFLFATSLAATLFMLSQLFIYPGFTHIFITFVLLTITVIGLKLIGSSMVHEANIDIIANSDSGSRTPILPWIGLVISIAIAAPALYFTARVYAGEVFFQSALSAAAVNDGRRTYNALIQAVQANPYRDVYRSAYAQTNLLLANSIASQPDLTDQQRDTITQLVQQAIREGKNAVALNPNKITNVESLATIYRNLLNIAEGADSWTVASYTEAIRLDPANPNLRIALGGIFYSLKNYDQAIVYFRQAVDLKPDLPNAYYNLASALREKGDYQNAYIAMQSVSGLVDKNTPDYAKVTTELEDLRQRVGEAAPTPAPAPAVTELEAPKPLPSPIINPPLELPSELGPETTPVPAPTTPPVSPTPQP